MPKHEKQYFFIRLIFICVHLQYALLPLKFVNSTKRRPTGIQRRKKKPTAASIHYSLFDLKIKITRQNLDQNRKFSPWPVA